MATSRYQPPDPRRQVGSPKPKSRDNKDIPCRNIMIYGKCRFENNCPYNHDQNRSNPIQNTQTGQNGQPDFTKKTLNVDSPSFTPAALQPTAPKKTTFSSQAANAAVFTPRGTGSITPVVAPEPETTTFNPAAIREFTPQNYDVNSNGATSDTTLAFDPYATLASVSQTIASQTPYNPYAEDHSAMSGQSTAFYQHQSAYTAPLQPLQYHLYAPVGPHRDNLLPFQRTVHDFFIPDKLREEYQRKSEATHQVMPNSQLPQLENYHSLVPLDTNTRKSANVFGYAAWVYKATSSKNGRMFCLRRLEGYRLTNEHAIRSVKDWRQLNNASVVTIHDAFTTRAFGDSSIIFVQDYHPISKTLAELHFSHFSGNPGNRYHPKTAIPENILWSYISQIANALKAIHGLNLAARCIDITKIVVTDKHRIRLGGCSILDVLQFEARRPIHELQQEDFIQFGKVMLSLATNTLPAQLTNLKMSLDQMGRTYSAELTETIIWLLSPTQPQSQKGIDEFIRGVATRIVATTDMMMHAEDAISSELYRELENGRLFRLMAKLGVINERPEFDNDRMWSENGERYMLKLFRDYVFHQVDAHGNPVLDLGHIVRCLNRLDAGSDDRICLTSRDEQTSFIVSYKDLKKQVNNAFGDLAKGNKHSGRAL